LKKNQVREGATLEEFEQGIIGEQIFSSPPEGVEEGATDA